MLAPRHLIFSALEGALVDARTESFAGAEDALFELDQRKIPYVLLTSRTREEIEPVRHKLQHSHPFVTENGGGIFFPDGYFSLKIPGVVRTARYLSIAQGKPYAEVCEALDDIAEECSVGVAGFHHMSLREIADNTGMKPRLAELARAREFDDPFYFTSADDKSIAKFVETARAKGYEARQGPTFWHFSSKCDPVRAVRTLSQLYRQSTHINLTLVGIGGSQADVPWLKVMDHPILLPAPGESSEEAGHALENPGRTKTIVMGNASGPKGWGRVIADVIG